ncbi:hypothetical protein MUK42_34020, partial [Musa troglodytarum]
DSNRVTRISWSVGPPGSTSILDLARVRDKAVVDRFHRVACGSCISVSLAPPTADSGTELGIP